MYISGFGSKMHRPHLALAVLYYYMHSKASQCGKASYCVLLIFNYRWTTFSSWCQKAKNNIMKYNLYINLPSSRSVCQTFSPTYHQAISDLSPDLESWVKPEVTILFASHTYKGHHMLTTWHLTLSLLNCPWLT